MELILDLFFGIRSKRLENTLTLLDKPLGISIEQFQSGKGVTCRSLLLIDKPLGVRMGHFALRI